MYNKQPGYPLPDGELGDDDLVCQLVYLPNRDEYWRALLGGLHYFTTWLAWERDDDKRGKDAAANWRLAFEKTMECWRMACLEDLENNVAAILALLQGKKDCCDGNVTYLPQSEYTTDIEPEVGDPPDYYGETAVTDWDDWLEHVCYNAHLYVDHLVHQAEQINDAIGVGMLSMGLIGSGLALLSFGPLGIPAAFAIVSTTLFGLIAASALTFDDKAEDIEDARDDIVCALINGTSLRDAVEDAVGSTSLEWTLFYSIPDYESAQAIIYEGGADGKFLPSELRDDCSCELPSMLTFTFDSDLQSWASSGFYGFAWNASLQAAQGIANTNATWRSAQVAGSVFYTLSGLSSPQYIRKVRYRVRLDTNGDPQKDCQFKVRIRDGTGAYYYGPEHDDSDVGWDSGWVEFIDDVGFDCLVHTTDSQAIGIMHYHADTGWTNQRLVWDDFALIAP